MSRTYRLDPSTRYELNGPEAPAGTFRRSHARRTYEPNGLDYFPQAAALGAAPSVREWNGVSLVLSPVTDAELDAMLDTLTSWTDR